MASYNYVAIDMLQEDFSILDVDAPDSDFKIIMKFGINRLMKPAISKSVYYLSVLCASRKSERNSYTNSRQDSGLVTSWNELNSNYISCTSKHLTQFAVQFSPVLYDESVIQVVDDFHRNSIFEEIPLLTYLLPSAFAIIVLILSILGLLMSRIELKRNDRFYNKLSLSENL